MGDYVLWFLLGVVIFVLAIVGFVRVLQLLFAGTKPRFLPQRCRNCEQPLHTLTGRCPGCSLRIADANQLADLRSTQRQLSQLRFEGVVNEEMYHELVWHIRQKQRGILHPEARRPTIPEAIVERPPAPPLPSEAIMDVLPVEPEPPRIPPVVESTPSAARERVIAPARQAENIPAPPSPPQARPRRSLGMWLAAFMEERNILWGELTGGLLMVGCSIALVLSLWKTLEQIPLFPFIILAAITSLLLAVGRYTLHHWKLEATSRGLLVIALLLVPLNFLVLAGLSPKATGSPIELGIKAAGIALFAVLATLATADLFPETATVRKAWRDSRFLALAVLGISVCPLAVPRLFQIGLAPENILLGLTLVPVALHAATIGLMLRRRWMEDNGESPLPALGFTGLASFPLALTFGFNILWTHSQHGSIEFLLQRFSILLAMAGTPLLASGLFVQRRASGSSALAGTLVALVGGLVQFAAIVLAWPDPLLLLAVASVNAIVWTAAAFLYRFPLAHAMAITNFVAGGWIAGQLLLNGTALPELDFHALGTGSSGVTFSILAAALVLAADMLRQRAAWNHGRFHALGAGVAAGLSLVLVSAHAIREPERAALVGLATAAGCLLLEWRWRITWLGQAGSLLLPAASLAALHWLWPAHPEFWGPMLAGEALLFGLLPRNWRPSMVLASFLAVGAAVISVASGFAAAESIGHTLTAVILSVTAMTQAYRLREAGLAWIGSLLLLVGLGHAMFVVPGLRPPMSAVFLFLAHAVILLPFLFVQHRERFAAMAEALCRSAQITSILASVVLLFHITPGHLVPLMIASTVLAMLWLLFALSERSQGWLMLLQVASSALVIFTMAKLRGTTEADLGFSKAFDFYGLGLAGLIAAWTGLRLWLPANELLRSRWPALERIVLGLLITATITLIVFEAPPAIMRELSPANRFDEAWLERGPRFFSALPGGAWLLLATLAAALVSNSWLVRSRSGQTLLLLGFLALATAAPVLASQAWLESRASASSLRWGLAIVFAVSCPLFWFRQSLEKLAARLGIRLEREDWAFGSPAAFLRGISVFVIAGIPLAITLLTMAMLLTGNVPAGPRLDSAFRTMGIVASHGIPLGLIMAGLAGHAVRERQPRYAFAGGLIGQLLVCGGFAVGVATRQEPFTSTVWTQLLLRSAITAAVWAGGWLPVAAWLGRFRDSTPARSRTLPSTWWNGQIAQSAIALGLLLGVVAFALIVPV
ncbi:MAG TPA: hypothetical protein VG013_11090, partial [Gemmataceae bacterium]|nr:hypothetical protein [Gemmataceae bacterium]